MKKFAISLACFLAPLASPALAEISNACLSDISAERMTIVVPNAPGGGYDTYARALAPAIERRGDVSVRVVNMPAGGGRAARSLALNATSDELIILIENTADLVVTEMGDIGRGEQAGKAFMIDGYDTLGIVDTAASAWLAPTGFDVADPDHGTVVASDGAIEEALLGVIIAGMALGLETDVVAGYDGSSDQAAAVLRGEVDITNISITSANRLAQDDALEVVLTLSNGPVEGAADIAYIAGEGSVVWQMTEGLQASEATSRRAMAQAVADLKSTARGLFISRNVPETRRGCIADVVAAAMDDQSFIDTVISQGRPVAPRYAPEAQAFVRSMQISLLAVKPLIDQVISERIAE